MSSRFARSVIFAAAAALTAATGAQAAIGDGTLGTRMAQANSDQLVNVQFFFGGRNYCWYDDGWRGPGWYWCGYAWRNGFGWGGGSGWHGWRRGGQGFHGGPGGGHPGPRMGGGMMGPRPGGGHMGGHGGAHFGGHGGGHGGARKH